MEDKEEEELLNLSLTIVTDSNGADMNMKRKRSREDHVFNPLMNSYEGCSEGKIYRLLQMREQMIKLDDKKKAVVEDFGKRLHLIHLLRITSTDADESNIGSALENLKELYQSVSLIGDSVQRVVAYFALMDWLQGSSPRNPPSTIYSSSSSSSSSSSFFVVFVL